MKLRFLALFLALTASFAFTACKEEDDNGAQNIVELAKATPELSTLVAALQRADLVSTLEGTGPFTVFAPTNTAFNNLLSSLGFTKLEDVPVPVLKQILLYHVVSGEVKSNQLANGYVKTVATFGSTNSQLSLLVNVASGVKLNKTVSVTTADVDATNGVVHIIDGVLTLPTVVTHAVNNPDFSILVAALTRSDLGVDYVTLLSGAGPFTVFAPTNAAFASLLQELGVADLNAIPAATLNAVLQYHVVNNANVLSTQLQDEQEVTTFGGGKFRVDLTGGAKIIDAKNRTANIVAVDVQSNNGVVHVLDKVILP